MDVEWGLHWFRWSAARKYRSPEGGGGSHKMLGLNSMQIGACPLKNIHLFCRFAFFAWLCPQGWPLCGKRLQGGKLRLVRRKFPSMFLPLPSAFHPPFLTPILASALYLAGLARWHKWVVFDPYSWIINEGYKSQGIKGISQNYLWVKGSYWIEPEIPDVCAVLCLVIQSCLTLWDPMDCNPQESSVYGNLQARIL